MIHKFLTDNLNIQITLAKRMETFTGILVSQGQGWVVDGQYFEVSQVSTCGYIDGPYVVIF